MQLTYQILVPFIFLFHVFSSVSSYSVISLCHRYSRYILYIYVNILDILDISTSVHIPVHVTHKLSKYSLSTSHVLVPGLQQRMR